MSIWILNAAIVYLLSNVTQNIVLYNNTDAKLEDWYKWLLLTQWYPFYFITMTQCYEWYTMTIILEVQRGKAREEVRAEIEDNKSVSEFEEIEKTHRIRYYAVLVIYAVQFVAR